MPANASVPSGADLARAFVALHEHVRADGREATLQRLVELAVAVVPDCDWAAVTAWPLDGAASTLASSDTSAAAADQLQYDVGEGPCLTAARTPEAVVHAPDLQAEPRWPDFTAAALARTPVRGVLSLHLLEAPVRSALNLYAGRPGAFGGEGATTIASVFAAHAQGLLLHAASCDVAANLTVALRTSRLIGTAVGVLMSARKVSADQAFALLRESSQQLQRKLRDVALDVTETGALPVRAEPDDRRSAV